MADITYGISPQGFVPKRLRDIRESIVTQMEAIVDPDTGEKPLVNITDDTVLMQVVGIFASELEIAWGALADAYAQFDPQLNTGAGQSGTVQLNGITRKKGQGTQIAIQVSGLANIVIPQGATIGDLSGQYNYTIDSPINLVGEQNQTVTQVGTATCTSLEAVDPVVNTVNTILSPQAGWYSVTNTRTIVVGTAEETDETLRRRQQRSTSLTSYRQIEAIWAAISNLDGVTYARVYQNSDTYPADTRGIPFKEVAAVVEGGDDTEIANAIWYRLPVGIEGYGNTSVPLVDKQGFSYSISFSRPTQINVYVKMSIKIYDVAAWPTNGVDLIKSAIIAYAEYNNIDSEAGFPPGTNIIRSRLYTPINSVEGFSVESLGLSTNGTTFAEEDIPIDWDEIGVFDASRIEVTIEG